MAIVLGTRSRQNMAQIDNRLVRVIERAASMARPDEDFSVIEGFRSREQCYANYGKGRTREQCVAKGVPAQYADPRAAKVTWVNDPLATKHRTGRAFDAVPYPIDWNNLKRFDALANLMFRAASIEGVAIRWGADWDMDGKPRERGESDSPHFELV